MHSLKVIQRLHEHRMWVNRNLMKTARTLSDVELLKGFPIGQGSVWSSILHLYAAEYVWLEALLGNVEPFVPGDLPDELPGNQLGSDRIQSLDELHEKWTTLDGRWSGYLTDLDEKTLDAFVLKKSTSSGKGKVFRTKVTDVLLHVCTHAQYTTAQTVNMFRHLGVDNLPDVMLITLARHV